ncbi:MAG TPA: transketolase C-terminal domain-containing protein, partial [Chloroflexota bacterium]
LAPLDLATIVRSIRKTSHLVIAHEAWKIGGFGAEISAQVAETALDALDAPIVRVGAPHVPVPSARSLREAYLPGDRELVDAIRSVLRY